MTSNVASAEFFRAKLQNTNKNIEGSVYDAARFADDCANRIDEAIQAALTPFLVAAQWAVMAMDHPHFDGTAGKCSQKGLEGVLENLELELGEKNALIADLQSQLDSARALTRQLIGDNRSLRAQQFVLVKEKQHLASSLASSRQQMRGYRKAFGVSNNRFEHPPNPTTTVQAPLNQPSAAKDHQNKDLKKCQVAFEDEPIVEVGMEIFEQINKPVKKRPRLTVIEEGTTFSAVQSQNSSSSTTNAFMSPRENGLSTNISSGRKKLGSKHNMTGGKVMSNGGGRRIGGHKKIGSSN